MKRRILSIARTLSAAFVMVVFFMERLAMEAGALGDLFGDIQGAIQGARRQQLLATATPIIIATVAVGIIVVIIYLIYTGKKVKGMSLTVLGDKIVGKLWVSATGTNPLDVGFSSVSDVTIKLNEIDNVLEQGKGLVIVSGATQYSIALRDSSVSASTIRKAVERKKGEKTSIGEIKDKTEELLEYKKLLDCGVITQEEFDTKKSQLLDIRETAKREAEKQRTKGTPQPRWACSKCGVPNELGNKYCKSCHTSKSPQRPARQLFYRAGDRPRGIFAIRERDYL